MDWGRGVRREKAALPVTSRRTRPDLATSDAMIGTNAPEIGKGRTISSKHTPQPIPALLVRVLVEETFQGKIKRKC
jgi:hypothetical protein